MQYPFNLTDHLLRTTTLVRTIVHLNNGMIYRKGISGRIPNFWVDVV